MSSATILVVDDEPHIRRVLRATLSGHGYDVIEANSGEEAIKVVLQERPDLILLDVNMPGMSGLEACRKMSRGQDTGLRFQAQPPKSDQSAKLEL